MPNEKLINQLKPIDVSTIRSQFKALRQEHGLKQYEMARILGMQNQNYSNFENGKGNNQKPTLQQIYNAMQYFRVSFEYFLGEMMASPELDKLIVENKHMVEINESLQERLDQCKEINSLLKGGGEVKKKKATT